MRLTDERAGSQSPLHRVEPDLGSRSYHGIRMIAEDRSRFAIRPFETAQGKLLLEVNPQAVIRRLGLDERAAPGALLEALESLEHGRPELPPALRTRAQGSRAALEAVIAARCAWAAVVSGEADRAPDELAPEQGQRVRREGWVYGMQEPDAVNAP
jgi:hypothetical protein